MSKREELIDFMDVLVFGKRHAQNETGNLLSGGSWTQLFNKVADFVDSNYAERGDDGYHCNMHYDDES